MSFRLNTANIVLLAKNHNPTIVSKEWLMRNNIISEEAINFAHLPVASMVETANFNLMIEQETLQLTSKKIENVEKLPQIIINYIKKLPETPYRAVGLNFSYLIQHENSLKDIFLVNDDNLNKVFQNDYDFGGIIKFKFEEFIVTLTIQTKDKVIFGDFNFHYSSMINEELIKTLSEYPKTIEESKRILKGLFNE